MYCHDDSYHREGTPSVGIATLRPLGPKNGSKMAQKPGVLKVILGHLHYTNGDSTPFGDSFGFLFISAHQATSRRQLVHPSFLHPAPGYPAIKTHFSRLFWILEGRKKFNTSSKWVLPEFRSHSQQSRPTVTQTTGLEGANRVCSFDQGVVAARGGGIGLSFPEIVTASPKSPVATHRTDCEHSGVRGYQQPSVDCQTAQSHWCSLLTHEVFVAYPVMANRSFRPAAHGQGTRIARPPF